MAAASPISKSEFATLTRGLLPDIEADIAVAVSGGSDSMALARLVAGWRPAQYLTVDHGLRPESAEEAKRVHGWLTELGLDHHVLTIDAPPPRSSLQEWARRQRYTVMERWCVDHGISELLVAHHLEDQAETFLLRLVRGSGIDGLAAMAAVTAPLTHPKGPRLVRPLLQVPKARLEATLRAIGQEWIEDPSNRDESHTRIRIRKLMGSLAEEGLTAARLSRTARRMRRARDAFDRLTDEAIGRYFEAFREGYGYLERAGLIALPQELALRTVSRLLTAVSGADYPPREEKLERLVEDMGSADFSGATLSGAMIQPAGEDRFLFCREPAAIIDLQVISAGDAGFWDKRFLVENRSSEQIQVSALGEAGWQQLSPDIKQEFPARNTPPEVRMGLPAMRENGRIVAVPHLSFGNVDRFPARFLGFGHRD